jgi:hypothetical protein
VPDVLREQLEDGACYKMVTDGALHKPFAYGRAQTCANAAGSRHVAAKRNLRLSQSEHVCRHNARHSPKNNYTSGAYLSCGRKAGSVLRGAIMGPESSVRVAGEANV